jgi:hypothetical protein
MARKQLGYLDNDPAVLVRADHPGEQDGFAAYAVARVERRPYRAGRQRNRVLRYSRFRIRR